MLRQNDIDYFNKGQIDNPRYWERLGGKPNFKDALVVDLGCGHGSLCIDIALSGAKRVIGIDLSSRLINFANENLRLNYPQLITTVEFRCQNIQEAPETDVDYFVSKNTFEHIIGLEQVLAEMKERLKPNGYIYTGFGPLWNSPFGDHYRTKMPIPWMHAFFTERFIVNWRNLFSEKKITSIQDLGLNALSLAEYRHILNSCGMTIVYLQINANKRFVSRLFSLLKKIPFLEEYFSHNIYCILQKRIEV